MRHIFYTNALQASEVGFKHFNISITDRISAATALSIKTFSITHNSGCNMCSIFDHYLKICGILGPKYFVSAPYV